MNIREENIKARIVFCKMLSILLFLGLLVGVVWGDNSSCLSYHRHETLSKQDARSYSDKEFVRQYTPCEDISKGKIHTIPSITGKGFGENTVEWIRIIHIGLIVTVIGGMVFLIFCL